MFAQVDRIHKVNKASERALSGYFRTVLTESAVVSMSQNGFDWGNALKP